MHKRKPHSALLTLTLISSMICFRTASADTVTFTNTPSGSPPSISDLKAEADAKMKQAQEALKQNDRKDGNGAAVAMAAVGAALAGASCLMLMKAAQEEEDPVKKKELMAKAMQECAQAAQNAANAAQNQGNKDQLAFDDSPKMEQPKAVEPTREDPTQPTPDPITVTQTPDPVREVVNPETHTAPSPQVFDQVGVAATATPDPKTSKLNPIGDQLAFDDSAKGTATGVAASAAGGMMGGFGFGNQSGSSSGVGNSGDGNSKQASRKSRGLASEDSGSFSGHSDSARSSESEGGSDVSGMLAKIMGGGKEAGDELISGSQLAGLATDRSGRPGGAGKKVPNIFEYTSYRVRKTQHDGDLKGGKLVKSMPHPKNVALVK